MSPEVVQFIVMYAMWQKLESLTANNNKKKAAPQQREQEHNPTGNGNQSAEKQGCEEMELTTV